MYRHGLVQPDFCVIWSSNARLPDIPHHSSAFRNLVSHVLVVLNHRVRDAQDDGRHPAQTLLHAAADILQLRQIIQVRQPIPTDAIELGLRGGRDVGEEDHGLDKAHEGRGRGVGPGLEQRVAHVGGLGVRDARLLLRLYEVDAEARLGLARAQPLLEPQPVAHPQLELVLVQVLRVAAHWQQRRGEVAEEREHVCQRG